LSEARHRQPPEVRLLIAVPQWVVLGTPNRGDVARRACFDGLIELALAVHDRSRS